ncbi:MAG: type I glyceraldehyde-3-phosphate dehydrogenase [Bdellovibrionaceae bacterium]|nr:type I glyceraldehyde-3-phosphate dehydrogenase [Pseudobdellovibrionaceae bacterium]
MSRLRVGINGFGRIGRILFRAAFQEQYADKIDIVGINGLMDAKSMAHLLKYDSSHGRFQGSVEVVEDALIVNGKSIQLSHTRNPEEIPWKSMEVDIVLECTGAFKEKEAFQKHIKAGAKKVLVSAPAPGADETIVYGINHESYDPSVHQILSNASCTTNCLAPVAKVLDDNFKIQYGMMTTVHSYTNDQKVLDSNHKDLRRARAAAVSMIPTSTGAAKAVGQVLPQLKGKIDGLAVRVPTPNVSLVDFVIQTEKEVTVEAINKAIKSASEGAFKNILAYENEPLVSVDYMGNPHSSIVDMPNTMVMGKNLAKVFSWYDNEMGFSNRMIDLSLYIHNKGY